MFYSVAGYPDLTNWIQMAIAHSTSADGLNFTEVETDIFKIGGTGSDSWFNCEVRAPSVIQDGTIYKMWFAGTAASNDWFNGGIGYATYGANCQ